MKYIGFFQVLSNNFASPTASIIEDLSFFDATEASLRRRLETGESVCQVGTRCPPGKLVATEKAGLHDTCQASGDFCAPASKILQQISKNEGDVCLDPKECRSGQCENKKCVSKVSFRNLLLIAFFFSKYL